MAVDNSLPVKLRYEFPPITTMVSQTISFNFCNVSPTSQNRFFGIYLKAKLLVSLKLSSFKVKKKIVVK